MPDGDSNEGSADKAFAEVTNHPDFCTVASTSVCYILRRMREADQTDKLAHTCT